MIYHVFPFFYPKSNMILLSIRTFWYKGSAENKKKHIFAKRCISLKNISLKLESYVFFKLIYDVNILILASYGIILDI